MADISKQRGVSDLLDSVNRGSGGAFAELIACVYDDLHGVARHSLRKRLGVRWQRATLQPSALVNEAVLDLMRQYAEWQNREHFFAIAHRIMHRIISEDLRRKAAAKRGRGRDRQPLDSRALGLTDPAPDPAVQVMEALDQLHEASPRAAEIAVMKVFCQCTTEQISNRLDIATRTVEREWTFAKAWLRKQLGES
ncbi:MAG: sigma-70 family RNA polymerase sigma factor [Phycisphaerales bacterium]|nr:sigma-70 family RNA polymerase sigma factor [Phycisphaerales bacterium]